ncbi:MAG: murein hydrolase activator EnvC family protein [Bacteroidia bacterium]
MRHSLFRLLIKRLNKAFCLLLCLLLLAGSGFAQSRSELEKRRKQKEQEIKLTRKLLAETKEKKKETLAYLQLLSKQIENRQSLIGTLQKEVHVISESISLGHEVVFSLESDLVNLRKEYGKLVYFMYKNRSTYSMLMFVFSSNSFNEAYKRIKFLQFYSQYRKKQVELIVKTEASLTAKVTDLKQKQADKQQVLQELGVQKQSLEEDKSEKDKLAQKLKGDEKKLRKQLKENQRAAEKLDRAIRNIIAKEIAANTKKAAKESGSSTGKGKGTVRKSDVGLTPEALKLSSEFAGNRAKLPWPVERGFITEKFGKHEHPTIPDVIVNNSGVKIRTEKGSNARCIFSGEVTNVIRIPGANKAVIVKHGNYFTVYSNLAEVHVHAGDKIGVKQSIGTIAENIMNGETEMELQIWKNEEKLNPEGWIIRK